MEYQGTERLPALQHFILDLVEGIETCINISSDSEHFILYFKNETFCTECSRLRYFTIMCNADEYKMMGHRPESRSVRRCTDLNKDIQTILWANSFIKTVII